MPPSQVTPLISGMNTGTESNKYYIAQNKGPRNMATGNIGHVSRNPDTDDPIIGKWTTETEMGNVMGGIRKALPKTTYSPRIHFPAQQKEPKKNTKTWTNGKETIAVSIERRNWVTNGQTKGAEEPQQPAPT